MLSIAFRLEKQKLVKINEKISRKRIEKERFFKNTTEKEKKKILIFGFLTLSNHLY